MAPLNDLERLKAAWRALAGEGRGEGWRTIPIEPGGSCRLLAGRSFPGNEEAVLFGFGSVQMPPESRLPQGQGFRVEKVKHAIPGSAQAWISLSRQPAGSLDMFSRMVEDVMGIIRAYSDTDDQTLFHIFLGRINAWQEFMQRGMADVLGPEAEVGLIGELAVLKTLLERGMPATAALESWHGPLDGLHDFIVGTGAMEVKSTVAASGFPASVDSLEQLDSSLVNPLFLAAVRLSLDSSGRTLPEVIAELSSFLADRPATKGKFESLVLRAGFLQVFSDSYIRRFVRIDTRFMLISPGFPALTRGKVNLAIKKVRYEIDLDLTGALDEGLERTLRELGVFCDGT